MLITTAHGGGGKLMGDLIQDIFVEQFGDAALRQMEDAAVLPFEGSRLAFTTDSFVVTPLFFAGGDIGRLAVCGTVNDLLMRGALPQYISAGFILEEGLPVATLKKIAASMKEAADEAGVRIVAGDTKVIEGAGGLYINTSGIGMVPEGVEISAHNAREGDAVIISGVLGDHHACILSARLEIENSIASDCAPLGEMVAALLAADLPVHTLRDITRGGLATTLHEIAVASRVRIILNGEIALAEEQVQGFCDILGLDPLYMSNEGKLVLLLPRSAAEQALQILRRCKYGEAARIVGRVSDAIATVPGVALSTRSGSLRTVAPLLGEGLPRSC